MELEVLCYCSVLFAAQYNVVEAELKGLQSPNDEWEEKPAEESCTKDVNKIRDIEQR